MEPEINQKETENVYDGWTTRWFRPEDKPSLLRLAAQHYGEEKDFAKEAFFDWLYGGGPAGRANVAVAVDSGSGEVIGFSFSIPFNAKAGDASGLARMGGNAVVRPDQRGKGIFPTIAALHNDGMKDSLFLWGFPKPRALKVHIRNGRVPVATIPLLIRPLDMDGLAAARFRNPALRLGLNLGWAAAGRTLWRRPRLRSNPYGIRISEETRFDGRFDAFWERSFSRKYEIQLKRDSAYLNWRFTGQPFRSYRILSAEAGGELLGYAVLRSTSIEQVKTGLIMDLLVEPGERGEQAGLRLVEAATQRFEADGLHMGGCFMLGHTQEYAILRKAGYIEPPARFSPQTFMLLTMGLSPETPNEYLLKPERWFVTMANHDAV